MIAWTINAAYTEATRVADSLVGGIPVTSGRHGGCRLRFGPEGYLHIAPGDSAAGTVPQDLTSLGGKVLRVDASTGAGAPAKPVRSITGLHLWLSERAGLGSPTWNEPDVVGGERPVD